MDVQMFSDKFTIFRGIDVEKLMSDLAVTYGSAQK